VRVLTFAPATDVTEDEGGGLSAHGFAMTSAFVAGLPTMITVQMILAVCALTGDDYDPVQYIIATSPTGERAGTVEFGWHWDDNPETPVKFRAFVQNMPLQVTTTGVYRIGLYDSLDAAQTDIEFPLPVYTYDPLTQGPGHF
jgi:hypothetical protein